MKRAAALLCLMSLPAFADLHCQDGQSSLTVKYATENSTAVTLKKGNTLKYFHGKLKVKPSGYYFRVTEYDLFGKEKGTLKISAVPVMSRVPPCMGRACNKAHSLIDYSAELFLDGETSVYDCKEVF